MSGTYVLEVLKEVLEWILRIGSSLLVVVILLALGWYVMWKVYLSRYEVFREMFGFKKERKPKAQRRRQINLEPTEHLE